MLLLCLLWGAVGSLVSATPRTALSCGSHELTVGTYEIESPSYPSSYPNDQDCNYDLSPPCGGSIALSCSTFEIEQNSACSWDWVQVNGERFCGSNAPSGLFETIDFHFHSDYSVSKAGYSCTLEVSEDPVPAPLTCDTHTLDIGEYFIQSPNHPSDYGVSDDCSYTLNAANSSDTVQIACSSFELESSGSCAYDWLNVNGQKFCGSSGPTTSATGSLAVEFHSDYSVVRSGYRCKITIAEGSGGGGGGGGGGSGSCCCGIPNRSSRIVGGSQTEVYEYPWQAGLVSVGGTRTWCGGTVINDRYVLTAAHCTTRGASSIEVLVREHRISNADGEQRFQVAQVIDHPSYVSASSSGYDFSLLKLSTQITFPADNSLAPACLPTAVNSDFAGADAVVTGWGTTSSGGSQATTLREVTVPVVTNTACRNAYSSINPSMICAGFSQGGKDSCQGDSGGPMVTLEGDRYSLIGVVSWGIGCALAGYPGVYARVTEVIGWIQSTTTDAVYCQ